MLQSLKETFFVRAFAIAKVPLLAFTRPRIVSVDDAGCVLSLPFTRINKNHLGSLYFGALCIGAEASGGYMAMRLLQKLKRGKGSLIFKDFEAKFLKRAEGETHFTCKDGAAIQDAVTRAAESFERVEIPVHITATVPKKFGSEPVAEFKLTLSLKVRK
jgi:acyl-coenzyme A thioesterase PaaI-like protein